MPGARNKPDLTRRIVRSRDPVISRIHAFGDLRWTELAECHLTTQPAARSACSQACLPLSSCSRLAAVEVTAQPLPRRPRPRTPRPQRAVPPTPRPRHRHRHRHPHRHRHKPRAPRPRTPPQARPPTRRSPWMLAVVVAEEEEEVVAVVATSTRTPLFVSRRRARDVAGSRAGRTAAGHCLDLQPTQCKYLKIGTQHQ